MCLRSIFSRLLNSLPVIIVVCYCQSLAYPSRMFWWFVQNLNSPNDKKINCFSFHSFLIFKHFFILARRKNIDSLGSFAIYLLYMYLSALTHFLSIYTASNVLKIVLNWEYKGSFAIFNSLLSSLLWLTKYPWEPLWFTDVNMHSD